MAIRNFEYTAGSLALNFVDTVAQRQTSPYDLINSEKDFIKWTRNADPVFYNVRFPFPIDVGAVKELREAIYKALCAVITETPPKDSDIELINKCAVNADLRPSLKNGIVYFDSGDTFNAILSMIAADAINCLAENAALKLRECPDCQMIFRDNSRPQNRIWCSSSSGCGNRAKVRRHRAKKGK